MLSAIRATCNTKVVSLIVGMLVLINLVLDPVLIFGIGPIPALGIQCAAIATVMANGISLIFSAYQLKATFPEFKYGVGMKKLRSGGLEILQISLPIAATNLILPVGTSLLTKLVAGYGAQAVVAFGITYRIDMITILFFTALTATLTPFLGQNRGRNNLARIRKELVIAWEF